MIAEFIHFKLVIIFLFVIVKYILLLPILVSRRIKGELTMCTAGSGCGEIRVSALQLNVSL